MSDFIPDDPFRLVQRFPLDADLSHLVAAINATVGARCHVIERDGEQWLFVQGTVSEDALREAMQREDSQTRWNWRSEALRVVHGGLKVPVVLVVLVLTLLVGFLTQLGGHLESVLPWLIVDFKMGASQGDLEWGYRLLSPIFLHFGALHLIFNLMWWWVLGSVLESRFGSMFMALLLVSGGVVSNLSQYGWDQQNPFFGGLSGVLYSLVGFIAVWNRYPKLESLPIRPEIIVFMIVWLVICMTGALEVFSVNVANAAHLGGMLWGAFIGNIMAIFMQMRAKAQ